MGPVPRKIILNLCKHIFHHLESVSTETSATHLSTRVHRGVYAQRDRHAHTHTQSISSDSHFLKPDSEGAWLHPGCRGFSRPLGNGATWEEDDTACETFHHYHLAILALPLMYAERFFLRCVLILCKWVLEPHVSSKKQRFTSFLCHLCS